MVLATIVTAYESMGAGWSDTPTKAACASSQTMMAAGFYLRGRVMLRVLNLKE
jgi:hypothetical protein